MKMKTTFYQKENSLKYCSYFRIRSSVLLFAFVLLLSICSKEEKLSPLKSKKPQTKNQKKTEKLHINSSKEQLQTSKINKILWITHSDGMHYLADSDELTFVQMNLLNTKFMAERDNYTVNQINSDNYQMFISHQNTVRVQAVAEKLNRNPNSQDSSFRYNAKKIIRRLIIYYAILEHGGVFVDSKATIVEPLDNWIQRLPGFPFINPSIPHQTLNSYCLAFYNDAYSSSKENLFPDQNINPQNLAVLYPSLQDYFLACSKGSPFLLKLTQTYTQLLLHGQDWGGFKFLNTDEKLLGQTSPSNILEHGHMISSHYVLQRQQERLNQVKGQKNKYAVQSFSLFTINSRLGPHKLHNQFAYQTYKAYMYLLKITIDQFQLFVGPLRFIFVLNGQVINYIIQKVSQPEYDHAFVEYDSFFHNFWLNHIKNQNQINQIITKIWSVVKSYRVVNSSLERFHRSNDKMLELEANSVPFVKRITLNSSRPEWNSLNKNIWVIWDNGIQGNSNLVVQLCYENLKKSAQNSGFKIQAVSKKKIHKFISNELLAKIQYATSHAAFDMGSQAISDLWRLALIYEHGGVYFDASTFMMDQSFDWITKITQFPENLIWNRYGQQPKVFMFWNTYYSHPIDWKRDRVNNVRVQWQLSLESNFIAAVKGNQLIKEWLDKMLEWVTLPFDKVQEQMYEVGMYNHRWTSESFWIQWRYLTVMDAIKYVLGKRQQTILYEGVKKYVNSVDYYKIWSIPGQFIGQQKLRGQTNYENRDYRLQKQIVQIENIYKYQYPQKIIEQVLGPIDFQGKFFNWQLIMMNKLLIDFYESSTQTAQNFKIEDYQKIIHPESVVASKLINRYPNKTLELLKHYSSLTKVKLKVKGFNSIWAY